ncbi:hypothetical protein MNBD_GAMMA03-357 [hydrothermal vent metagenome]|uniref:Serine protease n=1 Tax=hydrothermal vent metagenome TaxID=652676 RepID=A0A3B0VZ48_9ZZZZ
MKANNKNSQGFKLCEKLKRLLIPITLLTIVLSLNLSAQEKYIMLKPLTWDELQLYQLDSLKTVKELKLATVCPSTLKKLQNSFERIGTHFQHILGTNYTWTEYTNAKGLKCIVKHDKIDSIIQDDTEIINPNDYELLNTVQARVLKSASKGTGFKEKGLNEKFRQTNLNNQRITMKAYEEYGGIHFLSNYMDNHKASYKLDKELVKSLKTIKNKTVTSRTIPLYKIFEMTYSHEQQQELKELVKSRDSKKKINVKNVKLNKAAIGRVPDSQIIDSNFDPVIPYGTVGRNRNRFPSQGVAKLGSDVLFTPFVTLTAAHILVNNGEDATFSFSDIGAIPNGSGGYNNFNGTFVSSDNRYSTNYDPISYGSDYGVLRSSIPFYFLFYTDINIDNVYPRTVNVVGYPYSLIGMHKGRASARIIES